MLFYANPILIAAAVLPAIFLLVQIYRADKLDREPGWLIASLVFQGIVSTALAVWTERLGSVVLGWLLPENSVAYRAILYFVVVACSEEGFKYLLLKRRTWNSPEFNCQFDAVVYAVAVSLGFALWENIDYVIMYGLGTAMLRAVTAVPGHACFGVFMGAFYGMAKRCHNYGRPGRAKTCLRLSVLVPVLLHGTYDFIASGTGSSWVFVVFVAVMFLAANRMVRSLSRNDRYI